MSSYNGWKNYETWNVALWIGNDEGLYRAAVEYAKREGKKATYEEFIKEYVEQESTSWRTRDGVLWLGRALDYSALNRMIRELGED